MFGENIIVGGDFRNVSIELRKLILPKTSSKLIVTIAGESGSGKSAMAKALQNSLAEKNINSTIIQQDDYFHFPPKQNDAKRRKNIEWVGLNEVHLLLLQLHVNEIRNDASSINKPLVIFNEDRTINEEKEINQIVIIEGTYTSLLQDIDLRIFIDRNHLDTEKERKIRNREKEDEFLRRVHEIEHEIIKQHKKRADIIITSDFEIIQQ